MMMNGRQLTTISDLKKNFAIDDLISAYYSGELEFFLKKCGEYEKAEALLTIENNAFLLVRLYEILDIDPTLIDFEVRAMFS